MPNHLAGETSPYLLQHKDNPVDWYPWGADALKLAQEAQKPIFLSIGYAACHWCHVMAHESFEDPETAHLLNEHFIAIKVDREERPDLDDIYMQAVVALTGRGGWPMSVFLTPEGEPFYCGTYFPPQPRYGMPAFKEVLLGVVKAWEQQRDKVHQNSVMLTNALQNEGPEGAPGTVTSLDLSRTVDRLAANYDWQYGGWGQAPKFPHAMTLDFLIGQTARGSVIARDQVTHHLDQLSRGGLLDLVGGGFHRYSTDRKWLVPHFEKMLYDNAQLARVTLHAAKLTGSAHYQRLTERTLDFILREMRGPEGGFYASLDADTPEGEGRFYTWSLTDLQSHLTHAEMTLLEQTCDLPPEGNFEDGLNILQLRQTLPDLAGELEMETADLDQALQAIFEKLSQARRQRTPPAADQKIITAWNALAIQAFAEAGALLRRADYLAAAQQAADFILREMQPATGQLRRTWRLGQARHPGTLADYAGMILALGALYQADFNPKWMLAMRSLLATLQTAFAAEDSPLFYDSAADVTDLILRPRSLQDNAVPSGNAAAAQALLLMGHLEADPNLLAQAEAMIRVMREQADHSPTFFGAWLQAAAGLAHPTQEVALVSDGGRETLAPFLSVFREAYRPNTLIALRDGKMAKVESLPGLLQERQAQEGRPTAFVCQGFTCKRPITNPDAFREVLWKE